MKQFCFYPDPTTATISSSLIGKILLIGHDGILEELHFPNKIDKVVLGEDFEENDAAFAQVTKQLNEYFSGERQNFQLSINPRGTNFQKRVWQELLKIEYGQTTSYSEIALRIGNPKACRAVGLANGKNPIPVIIPCHRIIGKNGSLTGFGGGLNIKRKLLELEQTRA